MHIIIGVLTAAAGLFWALHSLQRAGVDLNAFNPFTWIRRRRWEKRLGTKPMHALKSSMEAAALLTVAIAKAEGEITRETKLEILAMFEEEFGVTRSRSLELFSASSYMLQDAMNMAAEVKHILSPSIDEFNDSHVRKLFSMLQRTATIEAGPSETQEAIIQAIRDEFNSKENNAVQW